MTIAPPDELTNVQAATLLGIGESMFRKLTAGGHIKVHRRGWTTLTSAVGGYCRFLRGEGAPSASGGIAARAHLAKAASVTASVERRRAKMRAADEVQEVLAHIVTTAKAGIVGLNVPGLDPAIAALLKREVAAAVADFDLLMDEAGHILMGRREVDE